ncbi:hypothetical protein [Jatrophihabitans sp. GAS493]|uniref:hypothetical protein n=1 Tax=Jatrophihabitans sp. GAS493 TaxID=1907575 RepID=UPI0012FD19E3|nr:hypothetical protein [Jatrophihabitans sp. GAS493]
MLAIVAAFVATTGLVGASGSLSTAAAATPTGFTTPAPIEMTRTHLVDGKEDPVDTRNVTLKVDVTKDLYDQQRIAVSWAGAHPSGHVSLNPNASQAYTAEYPMVLLQCRDVPGSNGVINTANPEVDPTTCWSPSTGSRTQLNVATFDDTVKPPAFVDTLPAWRLDRYADPADRVQYAHEPASTSPLCPDSADNPAEYRLPFVAADGTKYYGSGIGATNTACGPQPPEAAAQADGSVSNLPDNSTFATTNADGTGSALFSVRNSHSNASLGCSVTVACSMVAIPIMGISCDGGAGLPAADLPKPTDDDPWYGDVDPTRLQDAERICENTGIYAPGSQFGNSSVASYAVEGALWWSASNWRNRIVVPLTFAPAADVCQNTKQSLAVYGSELLAAATASWSAHFCADSATRPFTHVQQPEPQARRTLAANDPKQVGSVEAAFTSYAPDTPYSRATVQAPVAATGFAISYTIDDSSKSPYTSLRLTPRLLAKLMTESYPSLVEATDTSSNGWSYQFPGTKQVSTALRRNPLNITKDPEFIALNPGIPDSVDSAAASTLISLGTNSDVVRALTAYINADPEARAWLDGRPDPWGMVVNPAYEGISLPVDAWPLDDTWTPSVRAGGACRALDPQPAYLPLVSSPLQHLTDVAQALVYSWPSSQVGCGEVDGTSGQQVFRYTREPIQIPGRRFLIGLTSLSEAEHDQLHLAALQSQSTQNPEAIFSNSTGRTFVEPSSTSLAAAAHLLTYDSATMTWPTNYSAMRTSKAGATAYPGFMLVYADIPTTDLPSGDGAAYATLLDYLVGAGQIVGVSFGDLPAGFLPMTAANGLGAEAVYTLRAAAAVRQQTGQVPPLVQGAAAQQPRSVAQEITPPPSLPQTVVAAQAPVGNTVVGPSVPSSSPSTPAPQLSVKPAALESKGKTSSSATAMVMVLLIVLLGLLLLGPLGVPLMIGIQRSRSGR